MIVVKRKITAELAVIFPEMEHQNTINAAFWRPRRVARHKRFAAGKTLAEAEFTSAEHFNYRRVERRCTARNPMKKPRQMSWFFHYNIATL